MVKAQAIQWQTKKPVSKNRGIAQYPELFAASDILLEKLKVMDLGFNCCLEGLNNWTSLPGSSKENKLRELKEDHMIMAGMIRSALRQQTTGRDKPAETQLLQRLNAHEKAAWELDAILNNQN